MSFASPLSDEELAELVSVYLSTGMNKVQTALALDRPRTTIQSQLKVAARRGFLSPASESDIMPGFEVTRIQTGPRGTTVEQKPEKGPTFKPPDGHRIKGVSAFIGADGREIARWVKTREGEHSRRHIHLKPITRRAFVA
ncbi:hypothetical protein FHT87_005143 [Rhizobium sp. BK316]|uniref:hypothetical protein n=1 Tax=Rhizobium sp. BK316 TaxID=2587053 RepID=UPI0016180828|nr:hypothetical protein [Rhizobium sp. BK316]MBB3411190.1 hypothetical protein [Rhizobium sp. BK316]